MKNKMACSRYKKIISRDLRRRCQMRRGMDHHPRPSITEVVLVLRAGTSTTKLDSTKAAPPLQIITNKRKKRIILGHPRRCRKQQQQQQQRRLV
jgi:hypothetical protein